MYGPDVCIFDLEAMHLNCLCKCLLVCLIFVKHDLSPGPSISYSFALVCM
jgi:hypothetical protein